MSESTDAKPGEADRSFGDAGAPSEAGDREMRDPNTVKLGEAIARRLTALQQGYLGLLEAVCTTLELSGEWSFDATDGVLRRRVQEVGAQGRRP